MNNPRFLLLAFLATLAVAIGAYWVGPVAGGRARLELLALDNSSRFVADAKLAAARDSGGVSTARFPLVLAVRNLGTRTTAPTTVTLSVPGWIRLYTADGKPLPFQDDGEALVHYTIALQGEPMDPGTLPLVPAGLERLWIAAELDGITCSSRWDGVPELLPTPDYDRALLATVEAFYSLESPEDRYTGRLVVRLDSELLQFRKSSEEFRAGPVSLAKDGVSLPRTTAITLEGTREISCGAPEQRVPLQIVTWRTGESGAGRWIVIATRRAPRRLLYDTTGDGVVDFEAWDGEANGNFEAGRPVSYRIPPFLLPLRPVPPPVDSTQAERANTARHAPVNTPPPQRAGPPGSVRPDTSRVTRPDTSRRTRPDTMRPRTDTSGVRTDTSGVRSDTSRAAKPADTTRRGVRDTLPPPGSIMAEALRRDSLRRDSLLRRTRRDTIRRDTIRRDTIR